MVVVRLVELLDKDLNVKPVFFGLKEFYQFAPDSKIYYYSFNENQIKLGSDFKYFLNPKDNIETRHIYSPGLHMDSGSYYGLIIQEIINNLNNDQGHNFKDFKDLQDNYAYIELEYESLHGKRFIDDRYYSDFENEILNKYNSCKKFILSMAIIHQNFSKTKIYSKYFSEVEKEIESFREILGDELNEVKACNNYLLKLYGLESFISELL
jgi:hypothetical protein